MRGRRAGPLGDSIGTLLGDGREDAETGTELLDGATRLEPTVPLLLLGLEEIVAEVFPLLGCEHAQDPDRQGGQHPWVLGGP